MAEVNSNREGPTDALTIVGALAAAPYAAAMLGLGLRTLALESYPRAFGLRWNSDLKPEFPHGGVALVFGAVVLVIGAQMVASLVATVRQHRTARWLAIVWLILAIPVMYRIAWHPDRSRRCFVDGYRDRMVCASATTVTIRDFALLALPAIMAIGCLLLARARHGHRGAVNGSGD